MIGDPQSDSDKIARFGLLPIWIHTSPRGVNHVINIRPWRHGAEYLRPLVQFIQHSKQLCPCVTEHRLHMLVNEPRSRRKGPDLSEAVIVPFSPAQEIAILHTVVIHP